MEAKPSQARIYRFGPFELDARAGELRKHGIRIRLQEQPFQLLTMLLAVPGEVVLREEIQQRLWPNNTMVEFDHGINAAVKRLRTALNDSAEEPRYVETLARRGYRFIANVETVETGPAAQPSPAVEAPIPLDDGELTGRTVNHYRVIAKLGRAAWGWYTGRRTPGWDVKWH
jgi:DNA-binding winged helix-turn-helix (wHTH) protein